MKKTNLLFYILFGGLAYSQVGINSTNPKATLDITAKTTDGTRPEGIIPPRLTGDQIKLANTQYTSDQKGTIIYATSGISTADISGKASNITAEGYYYFDGNNWQAIGGNITANNGLTKIGDNVQLGGNLTHSTIISGVNSTNKLSVNATGIDAINFASNTLSIDATNNRVGIGTDNPQGALDVNSTTDGFILPRMTSSERNAIASPTTSTLVYDTTLSQYYFFTGIQWTPLIPTAASAKIFQIIRKNNNQTIPTSSVAADITFDTASGQGDGVIVSGANITLPAEKTFLITGYLAIAQSSNSDRSWARYEIVDSVSNNSNTVCTVASRGYNEPSTEPTPDSPGGPALCMLNTGNSPKTIKMRITAKRTDANVVTTSISDPYAETSLLVQEL